MENKALLWFKPEKVGWLLLRKANSASKQWRKLHCMIKGSTLYYIHKLNRPEPTGLLPLRGCDAELAQREENEVDKHCFVITLQTKNVDTGVSVSKHFTFAAETYVDCREWVGEVHILPILALNIFLKLDPTHELKNNSECVHNAAENKHILRLKLEHAQQELQDLELRWGIAEDQDAGKEEAPVQRNRGEEDPIFLQALADELMDAYHYANLARQSILSGQKKIWITTHCTSELQKAAALLESQMDQQQLTLIQTDVKSANECLEKLFPERFLLQALVKEIEVLEGSEEYGPEVAVMESAEVVLQSTLQKINTLTASRDITRKKSKLPDEGEIWGLREKMNAIYEAERGLLQHAIPGAHRLSTFFSEPGLLNQDTTGTMTIGDNTTGWALDTPSREAPSLVLQDSKGGLLQPLQQFHQEPTKQQAPRPRTQSLVLPHLQLGLDAQPLQGSASAGSSPAASEISEPIDPSSPLVSPTESAVPVTTPEIDLEKGQIGAIAENKVKDLVKLPDNGSKEIAQGSVSSSSQEEQKMQKEGLAGVSRITQTSPDPSEAVQKDQAPFLPANSSPIVTQEMDLEKGQNKENQEIKAESSTIKGEKEKKSWKSLQSILGKGKKTGK